MLVRPHVVTEPNQFVYMYSLNGVLSVSVLGMKTMAINSPKIFKLKL